MTYKFTEDQELWLRDLETTDAPQTRLVLQRVVAEDASDGKVFPVGFCCFGRACEVFGIEKSMRLAGGCYTYSLDGHRSAINLPLPLVDRLGLRSGNGKLAYSVEYKGEERASITQLNDAGMSFKEIAAFIRANPTNVFYRRRRNEDC